MVSRDFFQAGAKYISENLPASQTEQAGLMRVHRSRLNDLLAGRRAWTDFYKDRFASMCGFSVHTIILIGSELLTKVSQENSR